MDLRTAIARGSKVSMDCKHSFKLRDRAESQRQWSNAQELLLREGGAGGVEGDGCGHEISSKQRDLHC